MKKIVVLALALCLLAMAARAEAAREAIDLMVEGKPVALDFDSSEEYSMVVDQKAVASFYTYVNNMDQLYELTLTFPADVKGGDVVDIRYALANDPDCSVVFVSSSTQEVTYYFAGVAEGVAFPDIDGFTIAFDSVTESPAGKTYAGRLTASMMGMDMNDDSDVKYFSIDAAPFRFTMPAANQRADELDPFASPAPGEDVNPFEEAPAATPQPTREVFKV